MEKLRIFSYPTVWHSKNVYVNIERFIDIVADISLLCVPYDWFILCVCVCVCRVQKDNQSPAIVCISWQLWVIALHQYR